MIRENAIGENYREMSSSGFNEFPASLDEQDFRLLLLALGAVGRSTQFVVVRVGLLVEFDGCPEGRIGENHVEVVGLQPCVGPGQFRHFVQSVVADDVSMTIVMQHHVYFRDPRNPVVDFDSVQPVRCEIMPMLVMLHGARLEILGCFGADMIHRVEKKSPAATSRIQHQGVLVNFTHVDDEADNLSRREELSLFSFEEILHEILERNTLRIQIGLGKAYAIEMVDYGKSFSRLAENESEKTSGSCCLASS